MLFIEQQKLLRAHGGSEELRPHQRASVTGSKSSVPKELAEKVHFCGTRRLNNWELPISDAFLCANSVTDYGMCVVTALGPSRNPEKGGTGNFDPHPGQAGAGTDPVLTVWHLRVASACGAELRPSPEESPERRHGSRPCGSTGREARG